MRSTVIGSNLLLRPLVRAINRQPIDSTETRYAYAVALVCRGAEEERVRALLLQGVTATPKMHLIELSSSEIEDTDRVPTGSALACICSSRLNLGHPSHRTLSPLFSPRGLKKAISTGAF